MGSDRARVTYDERRQYRSVVAQQGRVTLEADLNESWSIEDEDDRKALLDVVGPSGTADDGYAVGPPANSQGAYDFGVGAGTMYVGGERSELFAAADYGAQTGTEWLDWNGDPEWVDPGQPASKTLANELVYLELVEQEVSATEDGDLREVALGGPDTAQRTRFVQRIKRFGTDGQTCEEARADAETHWDGLGLNLDTDAMRLLSRGRLQASFPPQAAPADPCDPEADGGYLGAENQLIRIRISSWDDAAGTGKLLWGYDNASFLYRARFVDNAQLVELATRPPDDFHQPRAGQAIELLRSAAELEAGEEYIASATGEVFTLTSAYVPDTKRISLPAPGASTLLFDPANPPPPKPDAEHPQVFLRVWEQELAFTSGTAVTLGTTGVQVTLTTDGAGPFHPGDTWFFAVRPTTPAAVYPERYIDAPQPPEALRSWVCPLAVVTFAGGAPTVLEDCRNPFDNLVELTKRRGQGCCDVVVRPEDLKGAKTLQSIIDGFRDEPDVTICLMPGVYRLAAPLVLGRRSSTLTIEGCHDGAILEPAKATDPDFLEGIVVLVQADDVTLRNIRFRLPEVPFQKSKGKFVGLSATELRRLLGRPLSDLFVSIGIRPVQCSRLTVDECTFEYKAPGAHDWLAAGVFGTGDGTGLRLTNNHFVGESRPFNALKPPWHVSLGYLLASSRVGGDKKPLDAVLDKAKIAGNRFEGLAAAVIAVARFGLIRVEENTVRRCHLGFLFLATAWLIGHKKLFEFATLTGAATFQPSGATVTAIKGIIEDPPVQIAISLGLAYPVPKAATKVSTKAASALDLALHASGDDVEAFVSKGSSCTALAVLDEPKDGGEATVLGNRLHNQTAKAPATAIVYVAPCTVTGSLVLNEQKGAASIYVEPPPVAGVKRLGDLVAVAGNVFRGKATLPPRSLAAPLSTWHVFNSEL
jgi:hypothetical protein